MLYCECVSVALVIQHAKRMRRITCLICGLSGSTMYFHIISQLHDFRKKKISEYKMWVLIFLHKIISDISHSGKNSARYDHECIYVFMYSTHSCHTLMKLEFFRQIFQIQSNIKFYDNPSRGRKVVASVQTDKTTLTVAFRSFANVPTDLTSIVQIISQFNLTMVMFRKR